MAVKHGLGYQNYEKMMDNNIFYIDKTDFIREWWDNADEVTLITRPRRFGKTLNLSTVECFFSNKYKEKSYLFEDKKIWQDREMRRLQGEFPVIFMSFASVKPGRNVAGTGGKFSSAEEMKTLIKGVLADIYDTYAFIMNKDIYTGNERKYFASVSEDMPDTTAYSAINHLCVYLEKYYGKKVIVLLDEYDTPMQEAWLKGFWDDAVDFLRCFFGPTFKTNDALHRGLITGITRISKESVFSDLNHLKVVTTTSNEYALSFGFTEEEVFAALDDSGLGSEKQGVKDWYDGFAFGKHRDIYNPWSIASFIKSGGQYAAYWANTSSNSLVNSLIRRGDKVVKGTVEDLLAGKGFRAQIDEQIVFNQLEGDADAVWSLLLATGYLKTLGLEYVGEKKTCMYTLGLTNMEVSIMFENMVEGWFAGDSVRMAYNAFVESLLMNDVESMNEFMNKIALHSFSGFDTAKGVSDDDAPERFYHGFVLGLIVDLAGRFEIKSNRESGFGRYDVMLIPSDKERDDAYIIEFKVHKPRKEADLEATVANAHRQIEEKKYEAELVARGFVSGRIRKYGFAFRGKECLVG